MAEHRFSFTQGEMDALKEVLDFTVQQIDGRLGTSYPQPIEVMALRHSRVALTKLRSKLFPSITAVAALPKAKAS